MNTARSVRVSRAYGPGNTHRTDLGQVVPLVALAVVIAGASVLLLGRLGGLAVGRAQARTAADAAALAGAAAGEEAALAFARANGARMADYEVDGRDTQLRAYLDLGGGRHLDAIARARLLGGGAAGRGRGLAAVGGAGDRTGLAPAMVAAIARAEQLLGEPVPVVSGWRSSAEQAALWASRDRNPYPVARPGTSMHEQGLAIDVPGWFAPRLARVAQGSGLCRPLPATDPIHFEVCRWSPRP